MDEIVNNKTTTEIIDELEVAMIEQYPEVECGLVHEFTPNMYIREITMPAGSLISSKWHNTEHPFNISKGTVSVLTIENSKIIDEKYFTAPYRGITKAGTRRILYVHEDCTWTTYHVNIGDERNIDKIEERIMVKHINPLLQKNEMQQIFSIFKRKEVELNSFMNELITIKKESHELD